MIMGIGKYFRIGLTAAALIGGTAACENTIFDTKTRGEGVVYDLYNEDGYQVMKVDTGRDAGGFLKLPPLVIPSPTEVAKYVTLSIKTPIKVSVGDRLNFRAQRGWTKPNWCQVYPRK